MSCLLQIHGLQVTDIMIPQNLYKMKQFLSQKQTPKQIHNQKLCEKSTKSSKTHIHKSIYSTWISRYEQNVQRWIIRMNLKQFIGVTIKTQKQKAIQFIENTISRKFSMNIKRESNYPDTLHKRNSTRLLLKECRTSGPIWTNAHLENFFNLSDELATEESMKWV